MLKISVPLLLAVLLTAQAPIPRPSQQPPTAAGQQNGPQSERGTQQAPLFVKVISPNHSQPNGAQDDAQRLTDLTGDLARYTLGLFIATCILGALTGGLLILGFCQLRDSRRMIRATQISASAARDSADAALSQLRPSIAIMGRGLQRETPDGPLIAWFEVENTGQSTAYKVQVLAGVQFLPSPLPGPLPKPQNTSAREQGNFDILRGKKHASRKSMLRAPKQEEAQRLAAGKDAIYLYGTVLYETEFGDAVESDFCQFLDAPEAAAWESHEMVRLGLMADAHWRFAAFGNDTRIRRRDEKT